jgi:hypothetical protein
MRIAMRLRQQRASPFHRSRKQRSCHHPFATLQLGAQSPTVLRVGRRFLSAVLARQPARSPEPILRRKQFWPWACRRKK